MPLEMQDLQFSEFDYYNEVYNMQCSAVLNENVN